MKTASAIVLSMITALSAPAAFADEDDAPHASQTALEGDVGQKIYARTCSVCHGERGNAASWAKNSLNPPPRDFTSAASRELSRARMMSAVTHGVADTAMVSFTTQFSTGEIEAVIDYVRAAFMGVEPGHGGHGDASVASVEAHGHSGDESHTHAGDASDTEGHHRRGHEEHGHVSGGTVDLLAPFPAALAGRVESGKVFYEKNCADCHGLSGDGRGPRAYFLSRKPRDFTSERAESDLNRPHLFEAIAKGVRQTEMAAWSKVLTAQEIADVAEYVFTAFVEGHGPAADTKPGIASPDPSKKN